MNAAKKIFNCIIADDDEIDRLTTLSFCRKYPFLQINGVFESAQKVLEFTKQQTVDVLLLDIDMPGMSGIELRKQLEHIPACIFITSHPEFALESFDLAVLDFLVKPLKAIRFATAMQRLEDYLDTRHKAELLDYTLGGDTLFIKDGHDHFKIQLHDIIYLEALKDYTGIITEKKKYCVLTPLGNLLKEHTFQNFVRIHRSYAVQKHFINKISAKEVYVNNINLPVGRSYKDVLNLLKL
ncbi:MAG: LytR/AlgR family response regulator transcription factor [Chitinophagaceae bacterium]